MSEMVLSSGHVVRHRRWFQRVFRPYVRRKLARSFDGVHVAGLPTVRARLDHEPLILAANHCSWWDALLLVALDDLLGSESYCLMDADNLRKLPFFGWLGAVPLDRAHPRQALQDLRTSAALIQRPNQAMWIFPQGRLYPPELRPLRLQRGVSILARTSRARVVPVSFSYPFREASKPAAVVSFGAPLDATSSGRALVGSLEEALVDGLACHTAFAAGEASSSFETLIGDDRDSDAGLAARVLSWFGREPRAALAGQASLEEQQRV